MAQPLSRIGDVPVRLVPVPKTDYYQYVSEDGMYQYALLTFGLPSWSTSVDPPLAQQLLLDSRLVTHVFSASTSSVQHLSYMDLMTQLGVKEKISRIRQEAFDRLSIVKIPVSQSYVVDCPYDQEHVVCQDGTIIKGEYGQWFG